MSQPWEYAATTEWSGPMPLRYTLAWFCSFLAQRDLLAPSEQYPTYDDLSRAFIKEWTEVPDRAPLPGLVPFPSCAEEWTP